MSRNASKLLVVASLLVPLFTTSPVYAQDLGASIKHVIECATWLAENDPRYQENCLPSRVTQDQIDAMMNPGLVMTGGTTDKCEEWERLVEGECVCNHSKTEG